MKKKIFFTVMALLCLNFWAVAQGFSAAVPLKVGDKLPDSFWKQTHSLYANGKVSKTTLAKYKGHRCYWIFGPAGVAVA